MDFIESCRQFVAIDSTVEQGSLSAARFVSALAESYGLKTELQLEAHSNLEEANIIVRTPHALIENEVMLQSHLDTVNPGVYANWNMTHRNPFDAHIVDGHIYGLGVADVKLDLLCKIYALKEFAQAKFRAPPVVVGTFGEESGMIGALRLVRKSKVKAKVALVGEASDLRLITGGLGYAKVEIQLPFSQAEIEYRTSHDMEESTSSQSKLFSGKAAHSSTPHLGESAVRKMLDYLLMLPEDLAIMQIEGGISFNTMPAQAFLEMDPVSGFADPMARKIGILYRAILDLESEFLQYEDRRFRPTHPTLNIGKIRTRTDHIYFSGICRISPIISNEIYDGWMGRLKKTCDKLGASFAVTDYKKPHQADLTSPVVLAAQKTLAELGLNPEPISQSSTNEASLFSRMGIECVAIGPGLRDGNIHCPNERVSVEQLKLTVEFYKKMIERLCL